MAVNSYPSVAPTLQTVRKHTLYGNNQFCSKHSNSCCLYNFPNTTLHLLMIMTIFPTHSKYYIYRIYTAKSRPSTPIRQKCLSWSPSPGSSMIVFLFFSYRAVSTFKSSLANGYLPFYIYKIKNRRFRWAGHVARMEEGRSALKILTDETVFIPKNPMTPSELPF